MTDGRRADATYLLMRLPAAAGPRRRYELHRLGSDEPVQWEHREINELLCR